jgi:hypothetical protein
MAVTITCVAFSSLENSRRTWEDTINIGVKETWFECVDWTEYTVQWRALLNTIKKLQILYEMRGIP